MHDVNVVEVFEGYGCQRQGSQVCRIEERIFGKWKVDTMAGAARVEITTSRDIVNARQQSRMLAQKLGFVGSEVTLIAAAVSEVARNIVEYADFGEIVFERVETGSKRGIKIIARDKGPGIPDIAQAMEYGYSTRDGGEGVGLPGAKWLMDEFAIESKVGKGTTITMKKWANQIGYEENHRVGRD